MDAFVQSGLQHAKLDHLQLMELNSVRPLLPMTLDAAHELEMAASKVPKGTGASFSSASSGSQFNNSSLNRSSF